MGDVGFVASVDCTAGGKPLCDSNGIQGFPTLKWGDPNALEDYQGGRSLDALKSFATENLKPVCSVSNIDLCDDEKNFSDEVSKLQKAYEKLMETKESTIASVKSSGLGLMKSVKKARETASEGSDELQKKSKNL